MTERMRRMTVRQAAIEFGRWWYLLDYDVAVLVGKPDLTQQSRRLLLEGLAYYIDHKAEIDALLNQRMQKIVALMKSRNFKPLSPVWKGGRK